MLNPQLETVALVCADDRAEAEKVLAFVQAELEIGSESQYVAAGDILKTIAQGHDAQKAKRAEWLKPFNEAMSGIKELADPVVKMFATAEELVKSKLEAYAVRITEARSAGIETAGRLFERGKLEEANALLDETKTLDLPKIQGVTVKPEWTGELVSPDDLIDAVIAGRLGREYVLPNLTLCQAATEAKQADPGIPGWRAFVKAAIRTSRKG